MTTLRWTFTEVETDETYEVPINPDTMSSPFPERVFEHATGPRLLTGPAIASFRRPDGARQWEFGGVIRTQAHHNALEAWSKKPGLIHVSDHLGRVFEVMFTGFAPIDRKPTARTPWRLRYTMQTLLLRRVS